MSLPEEYLGIVIDKERDNAIPEKGLAMLTKKGFYKKEDEESPQQSFARAATCYCFGDYEFAQRIYDYVSKGYFTFASPVLSTAQDITWPEFGKEEFEKAGDWLEENIIPEGLPISCFLSHIPDSKKGLTDTRNETAWLSMMGGGIGVYTGMRSPDEKSTGAMAHLKGYDADSLSYKQTESRRGSIAAYMDVNHPEIKSFLGMRDPSSGGDINKKCFNLNNAINITDDFMEKVIRGELFELIDPKHGATGDFLDARELWEEILEVRHKTGEPYLNFIDTINKNRNPWITKASYNVVQSNLCNEIHLMTSHKRTAVCCLSSLNLAKFDVIQNNGNVVKDLVRLLDNVLEYFIRLAPPVLKRAVHSASQERAIGLGTLGYHSYFQSKGIPFVSGGANSAASLTHKIYSYIKEEAISESKQLAKERGEPEDCLGSGMRNSHLMAIAPNASSSDMVGESPSIEPFPANCFTGQGRAGSFLVKNKYLKQVLNEYDKDTPEVWKSIDKNDGSVQHFDWMREDHKKVFKTFREIDPLWIIELASIRQEYLDQGQSVNLAKTNEWSKQYMSDVHIAAWSKGLKGLYYLRGKKSNSTSEVKQPLNQQKVDFDPTHCLSCEG